MKKPKGKPSTKPTPTPKPVKAEASREPKGPPPKWIGAIGDVVEFNCPGGKACGHCDGGPGRGLIIDFEDEQWLVFDQSAGRCSDGRGPNHAMDKDCVTKLVCKLPSMAAM